MEAHDPHHILDLPRGVTAQEVFHAVYVELMERTNRLIFGHSYEPNWPERVVQLVSFAEYKICNAGFSGLYKFAGYARLARHSIHSACQPSARCSKSRARLSRRAESPMTTMRTG
jgi:hypothetical protein